jgi:hypothetical protein
VSSPPTQPDKPRDWKSLVVTDSGSFQAARTVQDFEALLQAAAEQNARRRGSNCLDNTDFKAAYKQLINPRQRPLFLDILAEVGLVIAGGLLGYSLPVVSQSAERGSGWIILAAGIFLGFLCAIIKHIELS